MTALERIAGLLREARVAGGWIDEDVARDVLTTLALDEHGNPIPPPPEPEPAPEA